MSKTLQPSTMKQSLALFIRVESPGYEASLHRHRCTATGTLPARRPWGMQSPSRQLLCRACTSAILLES